MRGPYRHRSLGDPAGGPGAGNDAPQEPASPPQLALLGVSGEPPQIEGFRTGRLIGRGGMAAVYEAWREADGRRVALKLIAPQLTTDPEFGERFVREIAAASRLNHPHAVGVIDSGVDPVAGGFLAMELIEGPNLQERIGAEGGLPIDETIQVIEQVASALDEAHWLGLVHRDVKPANILLDRYGDAHLADFGVARDLAATRLTTTGGWLGSVDYAAPEQIEGRSVDARADVYALAAVAFHCLSGSVPFPRPDQMASMWAHVHAPRPSLPAGRFAHSDQIDAVIARGMAADPADRHPSAGDLAAGLAAAARGDVTARMPARPGARRTSPSEAETLVLGRRRRRGRILATLLAALALAGGAAGFFVIDPLADDDGASPASLEASVADQVPPASDSTPGGEAEAGAEPTEPAEPAQPPNVVGDRLDTATDTLERAGYQPRVRGGGLFGVVVEENWVVCEQAPADGSVVAVTVDRAC